jgi:hypothetical protein
MRYHSRRLTSRITRISRSITGCASSAPNNRHVTPAGSPSPPTHERNESSSKLHIIEIG